MSSPSAPTPLPDSPLKAASWVADIHAGAWKTIGILAALFIFWALAQIVVGWNDRCQKRLLAAEERRASCPKCGLEKAAAIDSRINNAERRMEQAQQREKDACLRASYADAREREAELQAEAAELRALIALSDNSTQDTAFYSLPDPQTADDGPTSRSQSIFDRFNPRTRWKSRRRENRSSVENQCPVQG